MKDKATQQVFKNFRHSKSLEELRYELTNHIARLKELDFDLQFWNILIDKPIFKRHVMNLFETLSNFKEEIAELGKEQSLLLKLINSQFRQFTKKKQAQEIIREPEFVNKQHKIELETFNFYVKISCFKFTFYQYMQSVVNN